MRWSITPLVVAAALTLFGTEPAQGQLNSSTNRSTMFGNQSIGGMPTAGNRTFSGTGSSLGGSSFGSSSMGRSSFGSGGSSLGMGGSSFGSSSMGRSGGSSFGGTGGGGQLNSNERFMRGARQPGQFVGSDTQDVQTFLRGLGATGGAQGANARSMAGLGGRNAARANQQGQGQPGQNQAGVRGRSADDLAVTVRPGFEVAVPAAATVSVAISDRLTKTPGIQKVSPIRVVLSGGTATLQGEVASPHDRALAEQLALLEPGVRSVKNELAVRPASGMPVPASAAPGPAPEAPRLP